MIRTLLNRLIYKKRKELPFVIFSSFLVTFVFARVWIYAHFADWIPAFFLIINGVHVHHFSYGILVLSLLGYLTIVYPAMTQRYRFYVAIFYGIALAGTFDEFGMWLRLRDDYWIRQSYDAVIVICVIFLNVVYFNFFWMKVGRGLKRQWNRWLRREQKEFETKRQKIISRLNKDRPIKRKKS